MNWARIKEIAGEALDRPATEREAFLDLACDGESELRRRVEAILAADEDAEDEGFLRPLSVDVPLPPTGAPGGRPPGEDAAGLIGKRIGRYRVKRLVGAGGMGAVYEAMQDEPRRVVALKVMRAGLASRSAVRRFQYEAQLLGRLRHTGIAQVYEAGMHETGEGGGGGGGGGAVPYFAMEYIPAARPITEFAESRSLGVRDRLRLFARVCDAVHHGHQKGIIHRDLKPSNILVDSSGQSKVIDFGVARATDSDLAVTTLQTGVGQLIGTLRYMSPEQCAAEPADIDTRSDVYSLGVVLFELLTGRPPYDLERTPAHQAARIIMEQAPSRPSTIDRTLRGDVETIVLKALEKDRDRRYQSAADLARDIERFLAHEPIVARPASLAYQASVFARRHRVIVGAALVTSVALLIALLAVGAGLLGALHERDRARAAEAAARGIAERAQRITDFLKATITAADPSVLAAGDAEDADLLEGAATAPPADGDFTVAESLRRAASMLDTAFPNDPATAAELADVIGSTLARLGRPAEAVPLLRRVAEDRRTHLGADDPETVRAFVQLADVLRQTGDLAGAERLYREAAEGARRSRGPSHDRTLRARRDLAAVLAAQGQAQEALTLQRETLQTATRTHGEDDPTTLSHTAALASVTLAAGDPAEAERLARRALLGLRIAGRAESVAAGDAAFALARALRASARWTDAESPLREAVRIYTLRFGPAGERTLAARAELTEVLVRLHRDGDAIAAAREAAAATHRAFGDDSGQASRAAHLLAWTLARCGGDFAEAESLARHAVRTARREGMTAESARIIATLADVLRRSGRPDEARAVLDELGATVNALPEQHRAPYAPILDHLRGLIAWDAGDTAEAERLLTGAAAAVPANSSAVCAADREELAEDLRRFLESTGRGR